VEAQPSFIEFKGKLSKQEKAQAPSSIQGKKGKEASLESRGSYRRETKESGRRKKAEQTTMVSETSSERTRKETQRELQDSVTRLGEKEKKRGFCSRRGSTPVAGTRE